MTGAVVEQLRLKRQAIADEAAALARTRRLLELTAADAYAWNCAVDGMIESLALHLTDSEAPSYADVNAYTAAPSLRFIVDTARRHTARGIPMPIFLMMLKTFRDACRVHLAAEYLPVADQWFDAAEIACLVDHDSSAIDAHFQEMSATARDMARKRERIEMALATVAPPMVLCDAHGVIIACSRSAEAVLRGMDAGRTDDTGTRALPDRLAGMTEEFLAGDAAELTEDITVEMEGERRIYAVQIRRVQGIANTTQGCVLLLLDSTESRQAEERLRSQDAAMASIQRLASIGWLAAGVAHEINNPLSTVMSYTEMLMEYVPFDKVAWLEEVLTEAERIADIVRRLQDLAQPGGEVSAVTPHSLLDGVVHLTGAHLRKRHTYLKVTAPKDLTALSCDPKAMQQALISSLLYVCALQRQALAPDTNTSITITASQTPDETLFTLFGESAVLPAQDSDSTPRYATLHSGDLEQPFISLDWARHIAQSQNCALDARSDDAGVTLVLRIPRIS